MPDLFNVRAPGGQYGYGPPNMAAELYKFIGDLPEDYFKGTQMARTRELQKPILDESGKPATDLNTIQSELLRRGGAEYAKELMPFLWKQQFLNEDQGAPSPYGGATSTTPRTGAPAYPQGQDANMLRVSAGQPPRQAEDAGSAGWSINDIVDRSGLVDDPRRMANLIAAKLRINPKTPLEPDQAAQVSAEIENQFGARPGVPEAPTFGRGDDAGGTSTGAGSASTQGQIPPQASAGGGAPLVPNRVQTVPAPPIPGLRTAQAAEPAPVPVPSGATGMVPPGADPRAYAQALKQAAEGERNRARRESIAGIPSKAREDKAAAYDKTADAILKEIGEAGRPTGAQKEARDQQVHESELLKARAGAIGKAQGDVIKEYIDAGRSAQKRIQSLDTITDALKRGGGNITTGPFAEHVLHAKQTISSLFGIDLAGTAEAEVAQKTGFGLATQAVKEISNRPTQFEFKNAVVNNPGLLLTRKGSFLMADVMKQAARQDIELGKLANRRENWDNWQETVDKFYRDNPLKSPFDRTRNLGMEDIKAIGGETPSSGTPLRPPSINEVHGGHRYIGGNPRDPKSWVPVGGDRI